MKLGGSWSVKVRIAGIRWTKNVFIADWGKEEMNWSKTTEKQQAAINRHGQSAKQKLGKQSACFYFFIEGALKPRFSFLGRLESHKCFGYFETEA